MERGHRRGLTWADRCHATARHAWWPTATVKDAQTRSCSSSVLVQETAEQIASVDSGRLIVTDDTQSRTGHWGLKRQRPVRAMGVAASLASTSSRFLACWATQAPAGLAVTPAKWTRRVWSSMKNSTYSRRSHAVSTVKKSQATNPGPAGAGRPARRGRGRLYLALAFPMAAGAVTVETGHRSRAPVDQPCGKLLDGCWNPDGIVMDEARLSCSFDGTVFHPAPGPPEPQLGQLTLNANNAPDVPRPIRRGPRCRFSTTSIRPTSLPVASGQGL